MPIVSRESVPCICAIDMARKPCIGSSGLSCARLVSSLFSDIHHAEKDSRGDHGVFDITACEVRKLSKCDYGGHTDTWHRC